MLLIFMSKEITKETLTKAFSVTEEAIAMVKEKGFDESRIDDAKDFLNMAESYVKDAKYFQEKGDMIRAFGCVYYAHGWLDAGARIGLFNVKDSRLFTVDD